MLQPKRRRCAADITLLCMLGLMAFGYLLLHDLFGGTLFSHSAWDSYTLQAMGKGVQSAALTFRRQGLLNIPLLLLMNALFGLYGMIWTQLVVEVLMLPVSLGMYAHTFRRIRSAQPDNAPSPTA